MNFKFCNTALSIFEELDKYLWLFVVVDPGDVGADPGVDIWYSLCARPWPDEQTDQSIIIDEWAASVFLKDRNNISRNKLTRKQ